MERVTVLYTTPFADMRGGGQESLLLLLERLDRARFSPLLLVPADGEVASRARALGARALAFELPTLKKPWRLPGTILGLRALLKREKIALIHAEQPRAALCLCLARKGLGIPLVWHIRTMLHDRLDPVLARCADRIVLVAKNLEERFAGAFAKTVVIYNGVDIVEARAQTASLPAGEGPLLVCPARVEADKGQDVLIEAARRLSSEFPTLRVWLAGREEPRYGARVREAARALDGRVSFLGRRGDARGLLALADVVVLPTFHEAFPRAVLEAMAAGKPVVASRVGGVPEAVVDGETGLLAAPGDPAALAAALEKLLREPALREKMGRAGLARVTRFTPDAAARGVERVYDELLRPA